MTDLIQLLLSNPQVRDFLVTMSVSASREAGTRVGKWVVGALIGRLGKLSQIPRGRLTETESALNHLISEQRSIGVTLMGNFWITFLGFMFPDREMKIDELDEEHCDYIAQRIYVGLGFEQLLLDIGYQPERIRYMGNFVARNSQTSYVFDLKATFDQTYFDNVLLAKVIDSRVSSPTEFVNSIPEVVKDINGDTGAAPALLRDHDLIAIIQSGKLSSAQASKLRQTIRTVQTSNDVALPRLLFFSSDEIENLITCPEREQRAERLNQKLLEVKRYRGTE